jgi:hypothetical protein
MLLLTP